MRPGPSVAAVVCLFLSLAGIVKNVEMIHAGTNLPVDAAERQAFIIGMFGLPAILLIAAAILLIVAMRRPRNRIENP